MGWYVVETELNRETVAQDCIHELGLKTFLPRMRRIKPSHHRLSNPYLLIFPRYIFVEFDLFEDRFAWPAIRRQRGVRRMLGLSVGKDDPLPIRDQDFQRLQELAEELSKELVITNSKPIPLAAETIVRILWGPMAGQSGKIEFDNGIRADVLLASAGVASKISLPSDLIEAV